MPRCTFFFLGKQYGLSQVRLDLCDVKTCIAGGMYVTTYVYNTSFMNGQSLSRFRQELYVRARGKAHLLSFGCLRLPFSRSMYIPLCQGTIYLPSSKKQHDFVQCIYVNHPPKPKGGTRTNQGIIDVASRVKNQCGSVRKPPSPLIRALHASHHYTSFHLSNSARWYSYQS